MTSDKKRFRSAPTTAGQPDCMYRKTFESCTSSEVACLSDDAVRGRRSICITTNVSMSSSSHVGWDVSGGSLERASALAC